MGRKQLSRSYCGELDGGARGSRRAQWDPPKKRIRFDGSLKKFALMLHAGSWRRLGGPIIPIFSLRLSWGTVGVCLCRRFSASGTRLFAPFPRKTGHLLDLPQNRAIRPGRRHIDKLAAWRLKNLILLRNGNSETCKIQMHDTLVAS